MIELESYNGYKDASKITWNPKIFSIGDVAYYVKSSLGVDSVGYGIVLDNYSDAVVIKRLVPVEHRYINGIPYNDFEPSKEYRKYTRNEKKLLSSEFGALLNSLAKVTVDEAIEEALAKLRVDKPEDILAAYKKGLLVDASNENFFSLEIDTNGPRGEFRLKWRLPGPHFVFPTAELAIPWREIYKSYGEAQSVIDAKTAEAKRVASLSDYDLSVEEIDRVLNMWAHWFPDASEGCVLKQKYRDFLLSQPRVEDIEIRMVGENIEWKYEKNVRWKRIEQD